MIRINGQDILVAEMHSSIHKAPGQLMAQREMFWGIIGASEIRVPGSVTPEPIRIRCWLTDPTFATEDDVRAYWATLDQLVGEHGRLEHFTPEDTGPPLVPEVVHQSFENCTFDAFEPFAEPGQEVPTPARRIDDDTWALSGTLLFTTMSAYNAP